VYIRLVYINILCASPLSLYILNIAYIYFKLFLYISVGQGVLLAVGLVGGYMYIATGGGGGGGALLRYLRYVLLAPTFAGGGLGGRIGG
jgi:hypothetical protein